MSIWGMHGDVLVINEALPDDFESFELVKDKCLAYGEVTGHAHRLEGDSFELRENPKTKERWLRVVEPTSLKHEEHKEVIVPPGTYRIGIQKEYDHFSEEIRRVMD